MQSHRRSHTKDGCEWGRDVTGYSIIAFAIEVGVRFRAAGAHREPLAGNKGQGSPYVVRVRRYATGTGLKHKRHRGPGGQPGHTCRRAHRPTAAQRNHRGGAGFGPRAHVRRTSALDRALDGSVQPARVTRRVIVWRWAMAGPRQRAQVLRVYSRAVTGVGAAPPRHQGESAGGN